MEKIIEQLKQWLVLSITDLMKIKQYISQKYENAPSKERAQILSKTIHHLLEQHLDGIDDDHKNALKYQVLASTIGNSPVDISKYDVFKSIFELELSPTEQISIASSWLDQSTELELSPSDILEFVIAYSAENDDAYIPETLISNYTEYQTFTRTVQNTSNQTVINRLEVFTDWFTANIVNAQFILTFLILSLIALTIGSSYFYKLEQSHIQTSQNLIPMTIQRITPVRLDAFVSGEFWLMKTVTLTNYTDSYEVIIAYESTHQETKSFPYKAFDYFALKKYLLEERNSLIGESPYFNQVITVAKLYNTDPLILFAISGQEQQFVSRTHPAKNVIINNPYNVFYSWKAYNTNITDTTKIAINTINHSLEKKPSDDIDAIEWLNKTYAEDVNWHNGVREIYNLLNELCRDQ